VRGDSLTLPSLPPSLLPYRHPFIPKRLRLESHEFLGGFDELVAEGEVEPVVRIIRDSESEGGREGGRGGGREEGREGCR